MAKSQVKSHILPFFIPMEGCPNSCIYCNQWHIAGQDKSPAYAEIEAASLALETPHELAFYGGSFTMLPEERQEAYLRAVQPAMAAGKISGIRLSTRPDAIDPNGLAMLKSYGVQAIELGVQSFDAEVLQASMRYYNADRVHEAAELIKAAGIRLGLQLMPGLPRASKLSDLLSLHMAADLQPDTLRIYPTLVLKDTVLETHWLKRWYHPLSMEEAIDIACYGAALCIDRDIELIRIGLHNTPELRLCRLAGPFSESFGAEVYSRLALWHMKLLQSQTGAESVTAEHSYLPRLFGHNACNRAWIEDWLTGGLHGSKEMPHHSLQANGRLMTEKEFAKQYIAAIGLK